MYSVGFSKFYWGFLFTMIDFKIQGFDVLPDIVGYIFFAAGFSILANQSEHFSKAAKLNIPMIILSIFSIYEKPVQGGGINLGSLGLLSIPLAIVATILGLLVIFNLFMGIKEMSRLNGRLDIYDEADKRWGQFVALQIAAILAFVIIFIPVLGIFYIFALFIFAIVLTFILMGFMKRCGESLS